MAEALVDTPEPKRSGSGEPDDPTTNVLSLVAAAMKRQDDLRATDDKWSERLRATEDRCDIEKNSLREKLAAAEITRVNALNLAESRRLDAVIAGGQANIALASEKQAAQAAQLASTVATTATAMASSQNALRDSLEKRLALVEQNQYATGGRDVQRERSSSGLKDNMGLIIAAFGIITGLIFGFLKP